MNRVLSGGQIRPWIQHSSPDPVVEGGLEAALVVETEGFGAGDDLDVVAAVHERAAGLGDQDVLQGQGVPHVDDPRPLGTERRGPDGGEDGLPVVGEDDGHTRDGGSTGGEGIELGDLPVDIQPPLSTPIAADFTPETELPSPTATPLPSPTAIPTSVPAVQPTLTSTPLPTASPTFTSASMSLREKSAIYVRNSEVLWRNRNTRSTA